MLFLDLKDGRKINLGQISQITVEDNKVLYQSATGSLNAIEEVFNTPDEANARYEDIKGSLLV